MIHKFHWFDLTARDFAALDPTRTVAVLPIAATEQHGPHLSVGTDAIIAQGLCDTVIRTLGAHHSHSAALSALFLPVQSIGKSNEHIRSPGTLTLSYTTIIRMMVEIGESIARAGVRKLVIVNAHGGNTEVMRIAALELREACSMLVVPCAWHKLGVPEGVFSTHENAYGIHGGDYETSLMLHFAPDRVRMDKAANFIPKAVAMTQDYTHLRLTGHPAFAWLSEDNHPEGVAGEAHLASAEKGRITAKFQARRFIELLEDVTKFPLEDLA